tara:strand:- start:4419 stop:5033 length:615 start_codon:yes stop_codon:yes gene_type:complete
MLLKALPTGKKATMTAVIFLSAAVSGCAMTSIPQYDNPKNHPFYMSEQEVAAHGSNFKSFYADLMISDENHVRGEPPLTSSGRIERDIGYIFNKGDYTGEPWTFSIAPAHTAMRNAIVHAVRDFCAFNGGEVRLKQVHSSGRDITPSRSDPTPVNQGNSATQIACLMDDINHYIKIESRHNWGVVVDGMQFLPTIHYRNRPFFD